MNNYRAVPDLDITMETVAQLESLKNKLECLRKSIDETQKYELLTTNKYLGHITLVASILEDLSNAKREQEMIGVEIECVASK